MSTQSHVHRCGRCRGINRIPVVAVDVATEQEPPKRGDPHPPHVDTGHRACVHCGHRGIPRAHVIPASSAPCAPTPEPKRGSPIVSAS